MDPDVHHKRDVNEMLWPKTGFYSEKRSKPTTFQNSLETETRPRPILGPRLRPKHFETLHTSAQLYVFTVTINLGSLRTYSFN